MLSKLASSDKIDPSDIVDIDLAINSIPENLQEAMRKTLHEKASRE
ncbi:hypothetical protein HN512_01460 [Candidatus Peregrinibacteria bacterium]|nr:hypothetical protein [Candidatus Peregrinibacteria bacterium]MBT3598483.1 hypothetical protein [Candidatus Peregrinibacteria bacterium]MBT4586013.1 hypothetical protein [Candidatus Peregrinibacteria bacterium]MBT6730848.1 hypothetical protein [Candidatus Peregrinibacteria bacterium]MBT7344991.1 hypothetical protein [Candidatus Peregrinibacteria bacterium]